MVYWWKTMQGEGPVYGFSVSCIFMIIQEFTCTFSKIRKKYMLLENKTSSVWWRLSLYPYMYMQNISFICLFVLLKHFRFNLYNASIVSFIHYKCHLTSWFDGGKHSAHQTILNYFNTRKTLLYYSNVWTYMYQYSLVLWCYYCYYCSLKHL